MFHISVHRSCLSLKILWCAIYTEPNSVEATDQAGAANMLQNADQAVSEFSTLHCLQCVVLCVDSVLCSKQCEVCFVYCALCSIQCALFQVQYTAYGVQYKRCAVYIVQCAFFHTLSTDRVCSSVRLLCCRVVALLPLLPT